MADPPPTDVPANGSAPPPETLAPAAAVVVAAAAPPGLAPKRQRRPSVRLGDIGEQPAAAAAPHDPYARRGGKQWRISSQHPFAHPHRESPSSAGGGGGVGKIPSRTRPLTNLVLDEPLDALDVPVAAEDQSFHHGEENLESAIGVRRGGREGRARRGGGPTARRVRTNWMSKADEGVDGTELKSSGEDAGDEGYREYDDMRPEDSDSPKEHSPSNRWLTNLGRRLPVTLAQSGGNMFSKESREACPATAAEAMEGDMLVERDVREWSKGQGHVDEDAGVRAWLNGLGLGRYAPVFEIHEVDGEVLPLLTLEDLKDMGINAVGSRRKMYCAIQKLRKSFS